MEKINTPEKFRKRMKEIKPDISVLEDWNGSQTKIKFLCKKCNTYFYATPNNMLKITYGGCPNCAMIKRHNSKYLKELTHTIDDFENKLHEIYGDEYILIPGQHYINNKTPLKIKHLKCGHIFSISYVNMLHKRNCPKCSNRLLKEDSEGVKLIESYLIKNNIDYEREVKFEGLKRIKPLAFDFCINLSNERYILIEYDGSIHFKETLFDSLDIIKERDLIKDNFCKNHSNLKLYRINFMQNKEEIYKILNIIKKKYINDKL